MRPDRRAERRARASSCLEMLYRDRGRRSAGPDATPFLARGDHTRSNMIGSMPAVADVIISRLRDAGVAAMFGVPGGGSNLDLVEAAGRARLPFVLTSTETAGALAAVAQAEVTGRPGACLTTLGPGAASVVNGVACARLDRAPLVVLTDSQPEPFEHQRIDHRALLAPVTQWSATIDRDN